VARASVHLECLSKMIRRFIYLLHAGISATAALLILLLPMTAQEPARVDISRFGVIGLAPGEVLTLKATAISPGEGCKAQLVFNDTGGMPMIRSLSVNLAPGQSASTEYVVKNLPPGRAAIQPVVWMDRSTGSKGQCLIAALVKSNFGTMREISSDSNCEKANCKGVPVAGLSHLTLRLYVTGTNRVCRAQMGFRQSNGRTSVTAKYVTLMPHQAAWLDWQLGDDDFLLTDFVNPEVAVHPGDSCVASSEVFAGENEPAAAGVSVHIYESSVVGLATDPASIAQTIQVLKSELKTRPQDPWVINELAQAYDKHGEKARAIKLLSTQVEISPRASESWLLLARFQYEQARYESAVVSLEKCLAFDPNNTTAKAAYADVLTKIGRLDEAGKLFATLLKDDKTRTSAVLTAYAQFLYTQGRFTEALATVDESDARHPNCGRTLWVEALVLRALERLPEATRSAERAVQIGPDFRPVRYLLMKLYSEQGKAREADGQAAWLKARTMPESFDQ